MIRYRIKKSKRFWDEFWHGPEYLSGFDFKQELDWRDPEGSYWSYFLIFRNEEDAEKIAKEYGGIIDPLSEREFQNLIPIT